MVVKSLQDGCQVSTGWLSSQHRMVVKSLQDGCQVTTGWLSNHCRMVVKSLQDGCQVSTGWLSSHHWMVVKSLQDGCQVSTGWLSSHYMMVVKSERFQFWNSIFLFCNSCYILRWKLHPQRQSLEATSQSQLSSFRFHFLQVRHMGGGRGGGLKMKKSLRPTSGRSNVVLQCSGEANSRRLAALPVSCRKGKVVSVKASPVTLSVETTSVGYIKYANCRFYQRNDV